MADFTVWDRATLEQFAREATDRMIADREVIEELVVALKDYQRAGTGNSTDFYVQAQAHVRAFNALTKHTQRKEQ